MQTPVKTKVNKRTILLVPNFRFIIQGFINIQLCFVSFSKISPAGQVKRIHHDHGLPKEIFESKLYKSNSESKSHQLYLDRSIDQLIIFQDSHQSNSDISAFV